MSAVLLTWVLEKMRRWVDGELEACITQRSGPGCRAVPHTSEAKTTSMQDF